MKRKIQITIIAVLLFCCFSETLFASTAFIENINKIRKANGYIFKISYQTRDAWTDGLVFKLFCTFNKSSEFSFTSPGYNNMRKGWHDTEIQIPKVYRERYGYITDYRIEMYHDGILVSMKSM